MDKLVDAALLKESAPRSHIAMTYGIAGLMVGMLFLGSK